MNVQDVLYLAISFSEDNKHMGVGLRYDAYRITRGDRVIRGPHRKRDTPMVTVRVSGMTPAGWVDKAR